MYQIRKFVLVAILIFLSGLFVITLYAKKGIINDSVLVDLEPASDISLNSNKYTHSTESDNLIANALDPYIKVLMDTFDYQIVSENENYLLYVESAYLSIILYDKKADYYYSSRTFEDYALKEPSIPGDYNSEMIPVYEELYEEGDQGLAGIFKNRSVSCVTITHLRKITGSISRTEEAISKNSQSTIAFSQNDSGFSAQLYFGESGIEMTLKVTLTLSGLEFEIPFDSIKENNQIYLLSSVYIYPFFGATKRARVPGYVFVPDGIGALIRYKDIDYSNSPYYKSFYGNDYGITSYKLSEWYLILKEESLYANLYGVIHGVDQQGYIAIIEEGAAQAGLNISLASRGNDFNQAYPQFNYRVIYERPLNQSLTNIVTLVQEDLNEFDIKIKLNFLVDSDANYVGMAKSYQKYLLDNNLLSKKNNNNSDIALHLDVLGAENKKAIIGRSTFKMTSLIELDNIISTLNTSGINNLKLVYRGWQKGGASYTLPKFDSFESKLGSKKELRELINKYEGSNNDIYFYVEVLNAYEGAKGYNSGNIALMISKVANMLFTGGFEDTGINYFHLKTAYALSNYQKNYAKINKDLGISNIAIGDIGSSLYSDYQSANKTRTETLKDIFLMKDVAKNTALYRPNSYLWDQKELFDVPIYSSGQSRFDDTVPFMSLVLSGYSNLYGRSANFFSNTQNELLRMIDYNIYPSFYVTNESSTLLIDSGSNHIYTSRFADWKEEIIRQYNYVNSALKYVIGATIVKRSVLALGVIEVLYSNGVKILVNYSSRDYQNADFVLLSNSYEVIR